MFDDYQHKEIRKVIIDEIAKKEFPIVSWIGDIIEDNWFVAFAVNECYMVYLSEKSIKFDDYLKKHEGVSQRFSLYKMKMNFCADILEMACKPDKDDEWAMEEAFTALELATRNRIGN